MTINQPPDWQIETDYSNQTLTMTGAQAQAKAIGDYMKENPRFAVAGVDIQTVANVKKEPDGYHIEKHAAYFNQMAGVGSKYGYRPGAIWPLPIAENENTAWAFGFVAQPASLIPYDLAIQQAILSGSDVGKIKKNS